MHRVVVCLLVMGCLLVGLGESVAAEAGGSAKKAFFLSLVLPGAGQYYLGERAWAQRFLAAEGALWLTYLGFRTYGNWRENDYELFAAQHAGVQPEGKNDAFFDDVGFYISVYEYNRTARWEDGADAQVYPEQPVPAWVWRNEEDRFRFRSLHGSSITAHRRALYVIGGVIINHVLSGIQAARAAGVSETPSTTSSWRVEPMGGTGVGVCVVRCGM